MSTVRSGDLLQPQMKKKKTVSTPKPRDLQSKQVDKYCLQHQEEDSQGDIRTALFKVHCTLTHYISTVQYFYHFWGKTLRTITFEISV